MADVLDVYLLPQNVIVAVHKSENVNTVLDTVQYVNHVVSAYNAASTLTVGVELNSKRVLDVHLRILFVVPARNVPTLPPIKLAIIVASLYRNVLVVMVFYRLVKIVAIVTTSVEPNHVVDFVLES